MILNPVIQGGGGEKVYKITDTVRASFPPNAKAGERVKSGESISNGTRAVGKSAKDEDVPV